MTQERVILVGVETERNYSTFASSMNELKSLTKTANGEVIFSLIQKRPQVDRQTVIGKGKLAELQQLVDAHEADLVIFNHELTPRQSQLIGEELGAPVIDRVQLILDIFAMRARSKEGKLQVELAQLDYLLPRLIGQGKICPVWGAVLEREDQEKPNWRRIDAISVIGSRSLNES